MKKPVVMIGSWPPRKCGIATFAEEAMEFVRAHEPDRPAFVICHTDGDGPNVFPLIDMDREDWYAPVGKKLLELDPYVVHLQHEYGLYNYVDAHGESDENHGFIKLLDFCRKHDIPTVVEPHTVHGRMKDMEEAFIRDAARLCNVLMFKCHYQKWRLDWTFSCHDWKRPHNIFIVPHGARADRRFSIDEVEALKGELELPQLRGKHIIGLVGWIQSNKRWDILTDMWDSIHEEICEKTGQDWVLLAAGDMRDPNHLSDYNKYVHDLKLLEEQGKAHFYKFTPRGEVYYKVMGICDFVVLPSIDETQSGTLARIIALNKPYVTTAPMEGLTAQTLESGGGLLFTNRKMLRERIVELATNEGLRWELGHKLYRYLLDVVSWEVIARQYYEAYAMANAEVHEKVPVNIPSEF